MCHSSACGRRRELAGDYTGTRKASEGSVRSAAPRAKGAAGARAREGPAGAARRKGRAQVHAAAHTGKSTRRRRAESVGGGGDACRRFTVGPRAARVRVAEGRAVQCERGGTAGGRRCRQELEPVTAGRVGRARASGGGASGGPAKAKEGRRGTILCTWGEGVPAADGAGGVSAN